ncbi:MAG: hypothetical protein Q8Q14_06440 [Gemmatimonadales bacterium]|nr:hypothetical protein [Gemmatimonadales bacterium]
MKRPVLLALAAVALLAACGKKRDQRAEIVECSSISLDAKGTAQCLVQLHRWKIEEARAAATARHHELDSLRTHQEDSIWNLDAARHRRELQACRRGNETLDGCLLVAGWPLSRVRATSESLWTAELPKRRRELQECMRRRDVNLPSCLTLYYKWDSDRAQRTADSVTRARLGGQRNSR